MAFKDLYENAKKQGASTAALKKIDEDARRLTGLGVTDRVVPAAPVVPSVTIPQPTATLTVKQPEAVAPTTEEKEAPSKKDAAKTTMEQAVKAYDDYIKSDEHKQRMQEAENKARLDAAVQATVNPNFDMMSPQMIRDEKAEQLRAARDQAEADYNRSLDKEVMAADQAAIADLTDEERSMLEQYAVNRIGDQNRTLEMQGIMPTAQQQASALIQKYGQQRVDELAESLMRQQNADLAAQVDEDTREFIARDDFLGNVGGSIANILTVPVAAMNGLAGTLGHLQGAARSTGRYQTLDANETGTLGDVFTGAVRGQVQQNIEGEDPNLLQKAASVGYQGIMSMADSIARGFLGGGAIGAGVLAATSTFSQVMSEASRNGATPAQAAALATVNSAIEAATEAIPLDELIKTAKGQGAGTVLKNVLRNAGIEATAEELSLVGTFLAEAAIMQEQSGYQQEVRNLILGGMSPEAARETANRNLLNEAVNTAFVAGLSGGLSSLGASVADAKSIPTPPTLEQVADMMLGDLVKPQQAVQEQSAPVVQQGESVAPEAAAQPAQGSENGGNDVLMRTMELMAGNDGKLSNKAAENILHDPDAIDRIIEQTGADITGTKSEQRAKLKAAMEQLFGIQNNDTKTDAEVLNAEQQAPQAAQQPEAVPPQAQAPQQQTPMEAPSAAQQGSAPQVDMQMGASNQSAESGQQRDYRDSNTYMNTGINSTNPNIRAGYRQELRENPDAARYAVKHNADTLAEARSRVSTPENANAALDDLLTKDVWTPEDVATSTLLLDQIMASGDRDAIAKLNDLRRRRKDTGVQAGQVAQSFSINNSTMRNADSPATAVDTFRSNLDSMSESETTYNPKSGVDFETWKQNIQEDVDRIGIAIATVEDGDADSMRDIIKQIARARKTTAWFGTSNNVTATANRILGKLGFEDLKKIANTQIAAMADDYRKRGAGEVAGTIRKQNMLSSLKTFARNIGGNIAGGFGDAVSESGAGQLADLMLSKFTGKRTVGNDLARGKEYARAAKEAAQFASLCVELNIPIETDADSSFSVASGNKSNQKYVGRTFRAAGNPAMRALYAYQKYMSYALEVTDKIFEGGSNAAVQESLARLQNANLTEQEAEALGQFAANKRTFKNATWEEGGKTRGAEIARLASSVRDIGRGTKAEPIVNAAMDVAMPFTNVPMNVAQTGIDYTAGVAKSIGEMISIIKDVKAGKTIPVERQRQAASDFGRGVTGTAMVGMFAAAAAMGALKASEDDDWNKEALAQAEGRSGAQINWSALMRGLNGESAKWQKGDIITGMDFLEPFNTQMYLGYEIANTEDMNALKYAGATIKSVWQSLMDSPVMTGLSDIEDTLKDLQEAETAADAVNVGAGYAGDVASSFIPQYVRQAAQEMDGYYRDTRGETAAESALNSIKAAIPGLSKTLPKKYSGLGEVQERGSALETFADPTATRRYNKNEVTAFLDELHEKTGDDSIYPERQAPMKIKVDGEDVSLDGAMRETYQKTYGENVEAFYSELKDRVDFQNMTQEQQIKALNDAEAYAAELAKAAVVEGYDGMDGWMASVKGDPADEIINKAVMSSITKAFKDEGNPEAMEAAYNAYKSLAPDQRKQLQSEATGKAKHYFTAKEAGISEEKYLELYGNYEQIRDNESLDNGQKAVEWAHYLNKTAQRGEITAEQKKTMGGAIHFYHNIQATTGKYETMVGEGIDPDTAYMISKTLDGVTGTGSNGTVRDIDTRGAIANSGLPEAEIDAVMKAYMSDYDPNAKTKQYTELKYDYIRQGLGLTPAEYAETYKAYLDGPNKAADIQAMVNLGFSKEVATTLYNVYQSTKKGKAAYMGFYEKQQ